MIVLLIDMCLCVYI